MLNDRELRVLAGIERNLSNSSPGLDHLLVEGRRSRLPHVFLGIGLVGFLVLPWFVSGTMVGPILLALPLAVSVSLVVYGLFHIPVSPDLPAGRGVKIGPDDSGEELTD
jgi:Protein of unknown function (DUF3040)